METESHVENEVKEKQNNLTFELRKIRSDSTLAESEIKNERHCQNSQISQSALRLEAEESCQGTASQQCSQKEYVEDVPAERKTWLVEHVYAAEGDKTNHMFLDTTMETSVSCSEPETEMVSHPEVGEPESVCAGDIPATGGVLHLDVGGEVELVDHVQGVSVKQLSELFAHDDTVSVVIVSDDRDPVWVGPTDFIMETQLENTSSDLNKSNISLAEVNYGYGPVGGSDVPVTVESVVCAVKSDTQTVDREVGIITAVPVEPESRKSGKRLPDSPLHHQTPKIAKLSSAEDSYKCGIDRMEECHLSGASEMDIDQNASHTQTGAQESQIIVSTNDTEGSIESLLSMASVNTRHSGSSSINIHPIPISSATVRPREHGHTLEPQSVALLPQKLEDKEVSVTKAESVKGSLRVSVAVNKSWNKPVSLESEGKFEHEPGAGKEDEVATKGKGESSSVRIIDSEMVYRCGECDYASSNKHYYKQHVDLVHKTARPFKCPFCDYAGKRGHALREHLIVHSVQKPFSCSQCNATFRKKAHLTSHTKLHSAKYACGTGGMSVEVNPENSSQLVVLANPASASVKVGPVSKSGPAVMVAESAPTRHEKADGAVGPAGGVAFWCALCKQAMVDASAFQAHLRSTHGTDRLFVCEQCDFVAADKSSIMAHLPTHLAANTGGSTASPIAGRPIFSCTECNFKTQSMNLLRNHAVSHTVVAAAPSAHRDQQQQPPSQQASKIICSECGLLADRVEVMRAHMWTHIDKNTEKEEKTSFAVTGLQEMTSGGSSVMRVIPGSSHDMTTMKSLPQNAAFKCTECSYTSRDASLFVKHMLVHKARQKPGVAVKPSQVLSACQQTPSATGNDKTITVSVGNKGKSSIMYQVKPVTTENTCKNTETSPFVHDAASGRFLCTICSYTCEYQRTIKAHIWKHCGHQKVDYPIFQNGPLSVYEVIEVNTETSTSNSKTLEPPAAPINPTTSLQTGKAKPVSDQSALSLAPSPNLRLVKMAAAQPALPRSAECKTNVTSTDPSNQSSHDAAGKHIIMHVRNGVVDPKLSLGVNAQVKQEPKIKEGCKQDAFLLPKTETFVANEKLKSKETSHVLVKEQANERTGANKTVKNITLKVIQASPQTSIPVNTNKILTIRSTDVLKPVVSSAVTSSTPVTVCKTTSQPSSATSSTNEENGEAGHGNLPVRQESPAVVSKQLAVGVNPTVDQQAACTKPVMPTEIQQIVNTQHESNPTDDTNHRRDGEHGTIGVFDQQADKLPFTAGESKSVSSASAPNVVVEVVPSVPASSSLTGLRVGNASPRVLRSQASSPVPVGIQCSQSSVSQGLVIQRTKAAAVRGDQKETLGSKETSSKNKEITSQAEFKDSQEKVTSEDHPSDSESAVTLLSLLKRGQNVNLASHQGAISAPGTEFTPESISAQVSPDRPPSTGSDSDFTLKGASEDTASEVESAVSSKLRGGSGGICSSLLAVIEQLRERSRSESDVEDKSVQTQPKKRAARRRGRQESQEETLGPDDGDNIEQLEGEDIVTYRCKLCHYTSSRIPLIRLHMRTHRQKDPFECSLCPLVAESSEALQEHMIQHCKVRTYSCKFCPQSFNHKSTLRAHMRAHNDADPFLCDLCEFETASPLEYRAHMQKHAGVALLQCPQCPMLLTSPQDLQSHLAGGCSKQGQTGLLLDGQKNAQELSGMSEASLQELLMCCHCDYTADDVTGLREHMARHGQGPAVSLGSVSGGEGLLRCALCEFTAVSSRSLKSHMKRHANDQRYVQQPLEQYKCALCGYVCHHLPSLKSHMWRHASDQNYSYQFTNDVINAAIDYDTRVDLVPASSSAAAAKGSGEEEPELLERFLSAERRIMEGQLSKMVADPLCWVTFRCCQCGFETINKAKLNLHMRTHADIINRTLKVKVDSSTSGTVIPDDLDNEKVKLKVVYEPV